MLTKGWHLTGLCVFVAAFAALVTRFRFLSILTGKFFGMFEPNFEVIIGIPSARSHFEHRQVLRETWVGYAKNSNRFHVVFIVGERDCHIPPEWREEEYSCEPLNISGGASGEEFYTFEPDKSEQETSVNFNLSEKLKFKVLYPIVIRKLGILTKFAEMSDSESYRIVLIDDSLQEEVVSVRISTRSPGVQNVNYTFKKTEPYHLPKGFEGSIMVEEAEENASASAILKGHSPLKAAHGFLQVLEEQWSELQKDSYELEKGPLSDVASSLNFAFTVYEPETLSLAYKEKSSTYDKHTKYLENINQRLGTEAVHYGDIVYVDVMDTYRNIPVKMLRFYEWLNSNVRYKYFIKTDDDCFLQVDNLQRAIAELNHPTLKTWWGNFRFGWGVDHCGKWAEHEYSSLAYPSFACGSGNLLTSDLISWIAKNSEHLHCYQGEDVSLGIWLSAILPSYRHDNRWVCDDVCRPDMLASAEHSVKDIKDMWGNWLYCKNPCGCG